MHPFEEVEWDLRSATITNERGELIFEQRDCEIPRSWSQLATNVVVSKYFRGHLGTTERESSVKQLIGRVVGRIHEWGVRGGYFRTPADGDVFASEERARSVFDAIHASCAATLRAGSRTAKTCRS